MRAYVVTEPEMLEILDRIEAVSDRIGDHFPYSETLLKKVAATMGVIMNDNREFEV